MIRRLSMAAAIAEALEPRVLLASTAKIVADIIPGPESSVSLSSGARNYLSIGNQFFFTAFDNDNGQQLFVSDGVTARRLNPTGLDANHNGGPYDFTQFALQLYFTANDGINQQIWRSDGTDGGTTKVTTVNNASSGNPVFSQVVNGRLTFFTAPNESNAAFWSMNPSGGQIHIADFGGSPMGIAGSKLFIHGTVGFPGLWVSDGITAFNLGSEIDSAYDGAALGNLFIFNGSRADNGTFAEPWVSDGTIGGTHMITNLVANGSSSPANFTTSGSLVYFTATDANNNTQIYSTNGTAVTKITNLAGTSTSTSIRDLTDFNGTLYFTYGPGTTGRLLYKLVNGTPTLVGTAQGGADGGTNPGYLTVVGNTLFFSGLDGSSVARLYETDGSTISKVGGEAGTNPNALVKVNDILFFTADDDAHGQELHALGGNIVTGPFTVKVTVPDAINEGDTAVLSVKVTPGTTAIKKVRWDLDGDGVYELSGSRVISHTFKDNTKIYTTPQKIGVEVTGKDGRVATDFNYIHIANVAPEVSLTVPAVTVVSAPTPYRIVVKDPGVDDELVVDIDFGDKQKLTGLKPGSDGVIIGTHTWTVASEFVGKEMKVQVRDKDGASKSKRKTIRAFPAAVAEAAADTGLATGILRLIVGGDDKNNKIELTNSKKPLADKSKQRINVVIDGKLVNTTITGEQIQIWAGLGDDIVTVASDIWVSVQAWGGGGKDTISGGSGNDTLHGESGSDNIRGNGGRDMVTGGTGNDNLGGGANPDTVLGGSGNDRINGNGGNDVLGGGPGADQLDDLLGKNELLDDF